MNHPTASVIVATLDESANIDHVLDVALGTDAVIEVIVADGGSEDGTVERVRERQLTDPRVRLIPNLDRHQSHGLNLAAGEASGDILVRLDGHTTYADNYVTTSISAWKPGIAIGGPMTAKGHTKWETAVANAMSDPVAIGPGRFHHASQVEEVDTVYLGTFARQDFLDIGGYRRFPSGTVEDTDFYARWRISGLKVVVDPRIRSWYRPRGTWSALATQYLRYGRGKAELLVVNRRFPSMRPLGPAVLVAAMAGGLVLGVVATWIPLAMLCAAWGLGLAIVGARARVERVRSVLAAATMHLAYGIGFWAGLTFGYTEARSLRSEAGGTVSR